MLIIVNPAITTIFGENPGQDGGAYSLQIFLSSMITIVLSVGGIVAFFMLLWGGFEYITAGGDKEATQKAGKRITSALIGLALLLSSFAIIFIVETLFGVSIVKFSIPTV